MKCLACDYEINDYKNTIVSPFLAERIFDKKSSEKIPVKLYHCPNCGFAFYDKRLSQDEAKKLYAGYRLEEYQKQRQKHDVWYSPEINEAIGGKDEIQVRCAYLSQYMKKNVTFPIKNALDFGGDKGQFYPTDLNIANRYVYDIPGIPTLANTIGISSLTEALKLDYDFIMCNHVLEHAASFDETLSEVISLGNEKTVFYFEVPFDSPFEGSFLNNFHYIGNPYFPIKIIIKHFINTVRLGAFAPMTEHINYFTQDAMIELLKRHGFSIIDTNTKKFDIGWNKLSVISVLCQLDKVSMKND